MTDSLDARIRRVCAEMMCEVMGGHSLAARSLHRDATDSLQCMADEFHEIATAPAEASGDGGTKKLHEFCADQLDKKGLVPRVKPAPSPSDPFEEMVEAFAQDWGGSEWRINADTRKEVRRALAAAIRKAPCTEAMEMAGMVQSTMSNSWRAMADALAAEMEGEK